MLHKPSFFFHQVCKQSRLLPKSLMPRSDRLFFIPTVPGKKTDFFIFMIKLINSLWNKFYYILTWEWCLSYPRCWAALAPAGTVAYLNCSPLVVKFHFFIVFLEGTVTNPAIWFVLYPVSIFLSLPTGHSNAFLSRRVHPKFRGHFFINIPRFARWAVFLSKHIGHYLKPINNLWILSFLSIKSLWLTEKYWFQNEFE